MSNKSTLEDKMKALQTSVTEKAEIDSLYAKKFAGGGEYETDAEANELMKKAEKKLKSFFSKGNKYEKACQLYEDAAGAYKGNGNYQEAADAYEKAAEMHKKCERPIEAAQTYSEAARCYKKYSMTDALATYEKAINLYLDNANIQSAGRVYQEIGEIQTKEGNTDEACAAYEKAINAFEACDLPANTIAIKVKVANIYMNRADYDKCMALYDDILNVALEKNLNVGSEKDYFYRALLCQFVISAKKNDLSELYRKLDEGIRRHRQFDRQAETNLIRNCAKAFEEDDVKQFTKFVFNQNKIRELDDFSASMLLAIKKIMKNKEEEPEPNEEEEEDYT